MINSSIAIMLHIFVLIANICLLVINIKTGSSIALFNCGLIGFSLGCIVTIVSNKN